MGSGPVDLTWYTVPDTGDDAGQMEFARACAGGHVTPLPAPDQARLRTTVIDGPLAANTVNGQVVAFPLAANTQVLWYLKSAAREARLDMSRPVTWNDVVGAASSTGLSVQVQASKYEGYLVWLNALIEGAGGDLVRPDSAARRSATSVIRALAASRLPVRIPGVRPSSRPRSTSSPVGPVPW